MGRKKIQTKELTAWSRVWPFRGTVCDVSQSGYWRRQAETVSEVREKHRIVIRRDYSSRNIYKKRIKMRLVHRKKSSFFTNRHKSTTIYIQRHNQIPSYISFGNMCVCVCGCFGNMCTCMYCVLYRLYCDFFCTVSFMDIYSYLFCLY